jgi:DNA polymerase-3 subunit epsilon
MPKVVALDFETANYPRNSAIALGISIVQDNVIAERKAWLFRPPGNSIYIRPDFIAIHGIRPADLRDKPHFPGIWPELEACLEGADLLIAHNAGFDRSVLYGATQHYGIDLPRYNWQCTVNIARTAWPHLPNHKLPTVCKHLGIELKHHDPASDAAACARIFLSSRSFAETDALVEYNRLYQGNQSTEHMVAAAQYRLGLRYCEGDGVAQNHTKAINYFRKAAEQGHAEARQRLEELYRMTA